MKDEFMTKPDMNTFSKAGSKTEREICKQAACNEAAALTRWVILPHRHGDSRPIHCVIYSVMCALSCAMPCIEQISVSVTRTQMLYLMLPDSEKVATYGPSPGWSPGTSIQADYQLL